MATVAAVGALILLALAAYTDLRSRIIPNGVSIGLVALFALMLLIGAGPAAWPASFGVGAAVFAVGAVLFRFGAIGGGDVKLAGATALWAGPDGLAVLLLITALAGSVLAALALVRRGHAVRHGATAEAVLETESVPYGVALAAGGAVVIVARILTGG